MATKSVNLRLENAQVLEIKKIAEAFQMSFTDVVRNALDEYLPKMERDPFYRLTANVREVSDKENEELAETIASLTDEDLQIEATETVRL